MNPVTVNVNIPMDIYLDVALRVQCILDLEKPESEGQANKHTHIKGCCGIANGRHV